MAEREERMSRSPKFPEYFDNTVGLFQSDQLLSLTRKKYLQSDWPRGVQYWPYLYSLFNICTLLLNKKNQHSISVAEK